MKSKKLKDTTVEKKHITIDAGVIEPRWEYHPNPRLEGLLKQLKYIEWKNVNK